MITTHVPTTTQSTKAAAKKSPASKAATPRVTAGKAAEARPAASKSAGKTSGNTSGKSKPASTSTGSSGKISAEQALANTRGLLEAKRGHNRQPQSWQAIGPAAPHPGSEGFQSPGAMDKAEELHAGESRMTAIEGSVSTRGRQNQGKRDHR